MYDKRRIKAVLDRICKQDIAQGLTDGFEYITHRELPNGIEYLYAIPSGYSSLDVRNHIDALFATTNAPVEIVCYRGRVGVVVILKDFDPVVRFLWKHLRQDKLLIGYNRQGEPVYHPLNTHLLIGGASGAGKTVGFQFWIFGLWLQGYEIWICDLKGFSYMPFETLPGVRTATSLIEAKNLLLEVEKELETRTQAVKVARNRKVIETFTPIAVVIDEAASLSPAMYTSKDFKVYANICDRVISVMGQKGREPKIFCLYCTQRPDAKVLNTQYKANVEAKIAFRTLNHYNSEIIIGRPGAEKIPVSAKGRCIYVYDTEYELQVPYVGDPNKKNNDDEWEELLKPFKTEVIHGGSSERKDVPRNYSESHEQAANSQQPSHISIVPASQERREGSIEIPHEIIEDEDSGRDEDGDLDWFDEDMET